MNDARSLSVKLLCRTFGRTAYSNIQLGREPGVSGLPERDRHLCSAIYYGVIERKLTLDHIISGLSSRPIEKLDDTVLNILRCGIYQLLYMDNIPERAAVSESTELAKKLGKSSASGMVNAVLRNFIRQGKKYSVPADRLQAASLKYSAPVSLISSLETDYGQELAEDLLADALLPPPVMVRRNPLVCTVEEFISAVDTDVRETDVPECYILGGEAISSEAFRKGYFHVQDKASQLCCTALSPDDKDIVLDICAAPGGKTFTMAEMMNGRGEIYAFDIHEKRVGLIRQGAQRLCLNNIKAAVGDAAVYNESLPQFTKILCDVPCSGLGAVRRKPEIKYKDIHDFERLPEIQYAIAENALRYLAVGGELVYSTCTLRRSENDNVCDRLLDNHPEIEAVKLSGLLDSFGERASIFPCHFGSDGFFIAKFRKNG